MSRCGQRACRTRQDCKKTQLLRCFPPLKTLPKESYGQKGRLFLGSNSGAIWCQENELSFLCHSSLATPVQVGECFGTRQPVLKVILNRQVSNSHEFIKGLKIED